MRWFDGDCLWFHICIKRKWRKKRKIELILLIICKASKEFCSMEMLQKTKSKSNLTKNSEWQSWMFMKQQLKVNLLNQRTSWKNRKQWKLFFFFGGCNLQVLLWKITIPWLWLYWWGKNLEVEDKLQQEKLLKLWEEL